MIGEKKQKSDYYYEYDLVTARKDKSQLPESTHQKKAIIALKKWFKAKEYPSGAIVALPTGSGKTFTAVRFLSKHVLSKGYKVLWLAHTHHLLEQAYYSFGPATTETKKGYEIGWIQEPRNKLNIRVVSGSSYHYDISQIKSDDDIVIATLQSIASAHKKSHSNLLDFIKSAEGKLFIVFDEAHHAPAPTYRELILSLREKYPKMNILGLTATPTYTDIKKRGWLPEIFPQTIVAEAKVSDLMLEGILAKPFIEENGTSFTPEFDEREFLKWVESAKDKNVPEKIVSQLASNRGRNQFIADTYVKGKERYGKTIMFADRWPQCEQLSTFLQEQGIRADTMYARTDNERNAIVLDKFKNNELDVVINIKMLTEGTDVPDVDTVFVTRQTTSTISITQMVGRALRGPKFGGTNDANLVFFYDDWQKTINWATWDTESWTAKHIYERGEVESKPIDIISIDAVKALIDLMDEGIFANPEPFLTFLPTGWYQVDVSEIGEEGNPEKVSEVVMVFEDEENDYIQFIESLKDDNLKDFDSDFLKLEEQSSRIKDWCESFFPNAEKNIGGNMLKNIFDITRHMAQNMKESPRFIKFDERKYHNLDVIAQKFIEKDYGTLTVEKKLRKEYNRKDRYWKVIYYNYDLFKSQYYACVEYILTKDSQPTPKKTEEELQVEKLKNGSLNEKIIACEILGEMGGEENIHDTTIALLIKVSKEETDSNVKKAARKALDIINSLDLTDEEKLHIKERDGYVCLCCGEDRKRYLQIDHIIPRWNEVNNSETNLQTLCKLCNITKSTEIIDFRETHSPLENPPNEIPYIYRIKHATLEQLNNDQWLGKFLKRSINFFYESRAVKNVRINDDTWDITLNKGNNPEWLTPHLSNLTEEIKSAREIQGYTGPNIIQINEPEDVIESEELIEDEELTYLLKTLQNDPDDITRRKAAYKLEKIKDTRIIPVLNKALDDKDPFAARAAARGLKLNTDNRSIDPLINKFKSDDANLRVECKDALISIGMEAIPKLLRAVTRTDKKVREMAVEALGGIGEKSTLDYLINALKDEESSVRWRAANALGKFDDKKTIKPLKDAQNDPTKTVQKYANLSLEKKKIRIKELYKKLDEKLLEYDKNIYKKQIASGDSYYSPKRHFFRTLKYNPYRMTIWAHIGNKKVEGIKRHKVNPDWGSIFVYNEEEFSRALEIIINGHKLFKLKTGEK